MKEQKTRKVKAVKTVRKKKPNFRRKSAQINKIMTMKNKIISHVQNVFVTAAIWSHGAQCSSDLDYSIYGVKDKKRTFVPQPKVTTNILGFASNLCSISNETNNRKVDNILRGNPSNLTEAELSEMYFNITDGFIRNNEITDKKWNGISVVLRQDNFGKNVYTYRPNYGKRTARCNKVYIGFEKGRDIQLRGIPELVPNKVLVRIYGKGITYDIFLDNYSSLNEVVESITDFVKKKYSAIFGNTENIKNITIDLYDSTCNTTLVHNKNSDLPGVQEDSKPTPMDSVSL